MFGVAREKRLPDGQLFVMPAQLSEIKKYNENTERYQTNFTAIK